MSVLEQFKKVALEETRNTLAQMTEESLLPAAELIWEAQAKGNRVHITGIGKPSHVAEYMASLMSLSLIHI